ncbi:hypothetical protein JCM8208_002661 [Rhodotorula glutinis]
MRALAWLGLAPDTRPSSLAALISNSTLVVCWLVLINAVSPFVLSSLLHIPAARAGAITGRLLAADELTALALYLPAGALGDRLGVKWVAAVGHVVVGCAFVAYASARSVGELLAARVLFAVGGGSLVTTMSSMMATMSAVPDECAASDDPADEPDERSRLVSSSARRGSTVSTASLRRHEPARLAGVLGFSSGLGALLAVFGFLRLPTFLASLSTDPDSPVTLEQALRRTLYLAAGLAVVEGGLLAALLPGAGPRSSGGGAGRSRAGVVSRMKRGAGKLVEGFKLAGGSGDVALSFAASFASRAQAIVVTAYIPLLANRYFLDHDLCDSVTLVSSTHDSCRQAYVRSSILTGVVQLLALLLSPLVGLVSSSTRLSTSHPQALALALAFTLGAASFVGFAFLPHDGDPRAGVSWIYVVGLGVAQAAGVVLSLALVTTGRGTVVAKEGREVAGTLSGAYGLSGGLGILAVGSGAGFLFDRLPGAPFLAVGIVDALVAAGALALWLRADVDEPV